MEPEITYLADGSKCVFCTLCKTRICEKGNYFPSRWTVHCQGLKHQTLEMHNNNCELNPYQASKIDKYLWP
jgi:hypothetical protein